MLNIVEMHIKCFQIGALAPEIWAKKGWENHYYLVVWHLSDLRNLAKSSKILELNLYCVGAWGA